ncbi:hypothetical protein ACFQZE_05910 [Paenibacillus sp. GCM10027627]
MSVALNGMIVSDYLPKAQLEMRSKFNNSCKGNGTIDGLCASRLQ